MWEDEAFANYISGQADADSTFAILVFKQKRGTLRVNVQPVWEISKAFDRPLLEEIKDFLGAGYITERKKRKRYRIHFRLTVKGKACSKLVEFFETFPLRANKRRDFELWKEAVKIYDRPRNRGNPWRKDEMTAILRIRIQMSKLLSRSVRRGRDVTSLIQEL